LGRLVQHRSAILNSPPEHCTSTRRPSTISELLDGEKDVVLTSRMVKHHFLGESPGERRKPVGIWTPHRRCWKLPKSLSCPVRIEETGRKSLRAMSDGRVTKGERRCAHVWTTRCGEPACSRRLSASCFMRPLRGRASCQESFS
jgi:hypothetical protein